MFANVFCLFLRLSFFVNLVSFLYSTVFILSSLTLFLGHPLALPNTRFLHYSPSHSRFACISALIVLPCTYFIALALYDSLLLSCVSINSQYPGLPYIYDGFYWLL